MRHLVTYDREAKANLAIALLAQAGIQAVMYGSENSAVDGPLMAFGGVQVMLVLDADHERALAVLAAQGGLALASEPTGTEPSDQAGMPASDRFRLVYLIAVVSFRILGVCMLIYAIDHATYVFEYTNRMGAEGSSSHAHYAALAIWAGLRTGMYAVIGLLLIYFSGGLSDLVTAGIRRK